MMPELAMRSRVMPGKCVPAAGSLGTLHKWDRSEVQEGQIKAQTNLAKLIEPMECQSTQLV